MKCIPADKLIAEIKKRKIQHEIDYSNGDETEFHRVVEDNAILECIASLQQEQPKFKVGDTIHKIGENTVFPMTIERISDGDYVCDNAHSFINIKYQDDYELVQQEQPEVDLDKEIEMYISNGLRDHAFLVPSIARHFYELGLNTRKEEKK